MQRHHTDEATIQKASRAAVQRLGLTKRASSHTHDSGVAWRQRCLDDVDLHAHVADGRERDEEPFGLPLRAMAKSDLDTASGNSS